jgi:predicted O-methyltransferase YrrM
MTEGMKLYEFTEHVKSSISCIIDKIGAPKTTVEIGVYEGYFTFNMTHMLAAKDPSYRHYSIDPYDESTDLDGDTIKKAHQTFLHNLSMSQYADNIEFIRKRSWDGMVDLLNRGVKADLIYVDGDHKAGEVLEDMVLGFKLLKMGGAMLCDDSVTWCHTEKNGQKPLHYSPRLAVDSFIHCNWGKVEVMILPNSYQSAFIKRGE